MLCTVYFIIHLQIHHKSRLECISDSLTRNLKPVKENVVIVMQCITY